jgi:probable phosphoglycerate mutase
MPKPAGDWWTGVGGAPTRLLLLRHGQTEMSAQRRYSGRNDPPLTERGREQARAAAARVADMDNIENILTSPLGRAWETAQEIAKTTRKPVEIQEELVETDFGAWDGLTFTEAAQRFPELHGAWLSDSSVPAPDGESFDAVHDRVHAWLGTLLRERGGRTYAVVSHVTPIKQLLRIGLGAGSTMLFRLHLDLASVSVVDFFPDGNSSVRLVNDTAHLR